MEIVIPFLYKDALNKAHRRGGLCCNSPSVQLHTELVSLGCVMVSFSMGSNALTEQNPLKSLFEWVIKIRNNHRNASNTILDAARIYVLASIIYYI